MKLKGQERKKCVECEIMIEAIEGEKQGAAEAAKTRRKCNNRRNIFHFSFFITCSQYDQCTDKFHSQYII